MNLIDRFLQAVAANPAAPACIFEGQVTSLGMFHQLTCKAALELHARGIGPGETVGVSMDHSPLHLATLLALARLGAVSLPVHPNTAAPAKRRLMERYGAKRLVCRKDAPALQEAELICLDAIAVDARAKLDLRFIDYWPEPAAPARVCLTSGTTGVPGSILYTHAFWLERINSYLCLDQCDAQSRLMPSDLHLSLGSHAAFGALFAGGVTVFHPLNDLAAFANAINLHAVTHVLMPPAMIKHLAARLPYDGIAFPTIRYLRIVGGGMTQHLVELATRKITPHIYLPYGMSEMGSISLATPQMLLLDPESAGRLKPGVEMQAVDAKGNVLPCGESGELRLRMPGMVQAYYLNEEKTAERFRDGWFMTRDCGFVTQDGLVKLEGRVDDKINLEGVKFFPERVETVLNAHPQVQDSAVFVVEDKERNKFLVAAVVPKSAPPFALKLVDYCKQRKLGKMAPQRFVLVRELPRNASGKIIRASLPELFARKPETQK